MNFLGLPDDRRETNRLSILESRPLPHARTACEQRPSLCHEGLPGEEVPGESPVKGDKDVTQLGIRPKLDELAILIIPEARDIVLAQDEPHTAGDRVETLLERHAVVVRVLDVLALIGGLVEEENRAQTSAGVPHSGTL